MSFAGLEEKHNRLYRNSFAGLLLLTVLVHLLILGWEVRTLSMDMSKVLLSQVTNLVASSAQTGDLISLQQNLESVSSPLSSVFPIDVQISRDEGQKMLVSARSREFSNFVLFQTTAHYSLMANPFGKIDVRTSFDFSALVLTSMLKIMLSCLILVFGLLVMKSYVLRVSRMNLVPVDQFTAWLSQITKEEIRSGTIAAPANLSDNHLKEIFSEINLLAKDLAQREINRRLSEVALQTAHDIRSPLSALKVASERIQADEETLQLVKLSVKRIELIASDLLLTYKNPASATLNDDEVHSLEDLLEPLIKEKMVQFSSRQELRLERDWKSCAHLTWRGPLGELQRVLSNLINNSAEAIESAGVISVRARASSKDLTLYVCDTGCGMSKETLARVGEKGFSKKQEGFGLGLSHVKQLAMRLGWKLNIQSKIGSGTIVSLTLPLE